MTRSRKIAQLLMMATVFMASGSCIGMGDIVTESRPLSGRYRLSEFEEEQYCVIKDSLRGSGITGELGGPATEIGWSGNYIVARRRSVSSSQKSGWMLIDVGGERVSGPYSDEEWVEVVKANRELQAIQVLSISEAWQKLDE